MSMLFWSRHIAAAAQPTSYTVQVDFAHGPLIALAANTWTDISSYAISGSTSRGRQYELDAIPPGTANLLLDNSDRRFEPGFPGPYYPNLIPMRKLQILVTPPSGAAIPIYTGFVERWPPVWQGDTSQVAITCVDAFDLLAVADLTGDFAAASSGQRINDVLDAIGWPAADRLIAPGVATIAANTWVATDEQKALPHLQDVMDAELGVFFIGKDGKAVFHDRNTRRAGSYLSPRVTLSDFAAVGVSYPASIYPSFDRDRIANDVKVTRPDGVTQFAADGPPTDQTTSQGQYGRRTLTRSPIVTDDLECADIAGALLQQRKQPVFRFDRVETDPYVDDGTHWPGFMAAMADSEISDRILVVANPPAHPGATSQVSVAGHAEQIAHAFGPSLMHATTLQTSPVDPLSYWVMDTSLLNASTVLAF